MISYLLYIPINNYLFVVIIEYYESGYDTERKVLILMDTKFYYEYLVVVNMPNDGIQKYLFLSII